MEQWEATAGQAVYHKGDIINALLMAEPQHVPRLMTAAEAGVQAEAGVLEAESFSKALARRILLGH
jgi:hypothetical protein